MPRCRVNVTAWSNGQPTSSGTGYGVRVSKDDRAKYFDVGWTEIVLDLGGEVVVVPVSASFWERCSELRSAAVGRWLLGNRLAPWPKGRPPQLTLRHIADNRFELGHKPRVG